MGRKEGGVNVVPASSIQHRQHDTVTHRSAHGSCQDGELHQLQQTWRQEQVVGSLLVTALLHDLGGQRVQRLELWERVRV